MRRARDSIRRAADCFCASRLAARSWTPASTCQPLKVCDSLSPSMTGDRFMDQRSLFGLAEHLASLSKHGDPLEVLDATVDFEHFRGWLVDGLGYGDGSRGGRPPFDPVSMFKALILQAQHKPSDARGGFMIPGRLSWVGVPRFGLGGAAPGEKK